MTGPDGRGDGDGWVTCDLGHRHWGLYGAAGLLLHRPTATGDEVLLQHRATWSHHGGTWGLLGGARHSDESAVEASLIQSPALPQRQRVQRSIFELHRTRHRITTANQ